MEIRSDLAGFRAAEQSMAKRSERIARATVDAAGSSEPPVPPPSSPASIQGSPERSPDLVSDIVGMTTDRMAGSYDIKAQKVRDRMMGELLDLVR